MVACVSVALRPVKFCRVVEPRTESALEIFPLVAAKVCSVVEPATRSVPPIDSLPTILLLPEVVALVKVASVAVNCCSEEELVMVSAVALRVLPFQVKEAEPERFEGDVQKVTWFTEPLPVRFEPPTQVLPMAKQPAVRRMPFAKVELAVLEVMLRVEAAKSAVVVAAVRVARRPVKFCRVVEPETRSVPEVVRPFTVLSPVIVVLPPSLLSPITSNCTFDVVADPPTSTTFVVVEGRRPELLKNVQFTS